MALFSSGSACRAHRFLVLTVEELGRNRHEAQALFHHVDANKEGDGDGFLGHALVPHGLKRAELIEQMQGRGFDVLGQGDFVD